MKILFSGCSFVQGVEVKEHERFSHLVCKALGAEEYNIAQGGRGNMMSAILAITEAEKTRPDYIVFGITYSHRCFYIEEDTQYDNLISWQPCPVDEAWVDRTWQLSPSLTNPDIIYQDEILKTIPIYRNNLYVYTEITMIINFLIQSCRKLGIPLCVFHGANPEPEPSSINGVPISETLLQMPRSEPEFLELDLRAFVNYGNEYDMQPERHPGPIANRAFADLLISKIKSDLNI